MSEPKLTLYEEWLATGDHPELASFRDKVDEITKKMEAAEGIAAQMKVAWQVEDLRAGFAKDEEMEAPAGAGLDQRDQRKSQLAAVQKRRDSQQT